MIQLEKALAELARHEVEFVIATIYGSAYITFDLDFCYSREPANLERLARALAPFHPRLRDAPPDIPFVWDARTCHNGFHFSLTTDVGDLDLLGELPGVLSLDALIRSKRAAGRQKDLLTLPELEVLREAGRDSTS
ncbi:MAG: hypothetical protein HY238_24705 [Acidobacteria bacterium]|nr:hypothetical protein [Acidobacteriota bacterium]